MTTDFKAKYREGSRLHTLYEFWEENGGPATYDYGVGELGLAVSTTWGTIRMWAKAKGVPSGLEKKPTSAPTPAPAQKPKKEKGPAPSLTDLAEKITKPKKIATPSPSRVQVREIGYSKKRTGVVIDPGEEVSNVSWDTGFTRAVSNKYLIKLLPDGSDDEAAKTEWQREEDEAFWRRKTKLKKDDEPIVKIKAT